MKKAQARRETKEAFQITGLTSGAYSKTKAECYNVSAEHCWTLRP